ncbi:MAG: type VI secretion system tip protein VgrG, partial [Gemmatimonadetes bacterium]|nr:type VI secretion system tip protein VgrG [Gemmatimonadota bacterium]
MSEFTQAERSLRVETILGTDVLLLDSFAGTEAVSRPFSYRIDMLSLEPEIVAADLLRTTMRLDIDLPEGGTRYVHGMVRSFAQLGQSEELTAYRAEVVPWTWFLSLSHECRIHQNKTVREIVATVFEDLGFPDFEDRCTRSYTPREYCVQYRENHLNFVSRLLEEEGIFTFFEHSEDRHVLVLADDNSAFHPVLGHPEMWMWRGQNMGAADGITSLERERSARLGRVVLNDYDWLQPQMSLLSQLDGAEPEEFYDYHPRHYTTQDLGDRYSRLRLEEHEARREVVLGRANCRHFEAGRTFELREHYREDMNEEYALLQVSQAGRTPDYRGRDTPTTEYDVSFVAMPSRVPYRPTQTAVRPTIQGLQTAEVVGKAGEEIWTDSHGRIKVQFHWDREGQKDENSSCWIRVATPWAGKGYGSISIPRIGNEVVVAFEEGDPDRPLVLGSVYNAVQTPPFGLPGSGIQMGMKSHSSPGGGGSNEITMTDTKGSEMMNIHAQYDQVTTVQNDQTNTINNNRTTSVAVDDTESVGSNQSIDVGADQSTTVGGNRTVTVGANQQTTIGANADTTVSGNESAAVGGSRSISIGANDDLSVGGNQTMGAGGNAELSAGANYTIKGGVNVEVDAGAKVTIKAGA